MAHKIRIVTETVIVYLVFLLCSMQSLFVNSASRTITITAKGELISLIFYKLPLIAVIVLLSKKNFFLRQQNHNPVYVESKSKKITCKNFFLSVATSLAGLFCAAFLVSFICNIFVESRAFSLDIQNSVFIHIIIIISSISTAYVEELFFRFFLLKVFLEKIPLLIAITISSLMFAACHIIQGLQGIANAFIAGIILCIIFNRLKSFNGIAIAHALFDIVAFETYL
ncbi:MAG: hypothetical protein Ta2F_03330 [Termitinemataceae bacterium]|nr:MAG: hypothetical protein Ta2F_03330 [Termitinemataceae bacterium]